MDIKDATDHFSLWKEAIALLLAILALVGINIRSKKGNNLITKQDLDLAMANHTAELKACIHEVADTMNSRTDEKIGRIYDHANDQNYKTNLRIDAFMRSDFDRGG